MMEVQKYLIANGLEKLQQEFSIIVTDYPDRVVLNYNQIESPRFHPVVDECRALILRKGTWEVITRSFNRFMNLGEGVQQAENVPIETQRIASFNEYETKLFQLEHALIQEKLDGCCAEDIIVITDKGPKTIRNLCESKEKVKILAYDTNVDKITWAKVESFSIKENNNDWFEIELDNGIKIKLTSNHYVWMSELKCYRKVSDLKEGDLVLVKE